MKRKVFARRAASAALAACMMFTLSAPALAESTDALRQLSTSAKSAVSVLDMQNDISESATTLDLCSGSITVSIEDGKQYAEQNGSKQQISNLVVTTNGVQTGNTLIIRGGDSIAAKVTLNDAVISTSGAAVSVSGDVELYIEGRSTLQSGEECAGIQKEDDGHLKIDGSGSLEVYGGTYSAGIGGGSAKNKGCGRNITINGGDITANGGYRGAGIGGGYAWGRSAEGHGEYITINGGNVTAIGGNGGAGIGGGSIVRFNDSDGGHGQYITINGGIVKAVAGSNAFAIGAGQDGWGRYITINGGDVTVQAENRWIGGRHGEVDKNSLNGVITYLDKDGNVVDSANWDITVNGTAVNGVNYKDILGDGALCYDIEEKTLKLQDGKFFDGALTITAPDDVSIDLEADASHVVNGNLTVTGAKDVTVIKAKEVNPDAAVEGKIEITCSGTVKLENQSGSWSGGRNLAAGGLTVHSAESVKTEGFISGETVINCIGDAMLGNMYGTTVSKLKVLNANNVKVTSGSDNCSVSQGAEIKCTGAVDIGNKINGDVKIEAGQDVSILYVGEHSEIQIKTAGKVELNSYSNLGNVIFTQADNKPYVYFTEKSSSEYKDSRIETLPNPYSGTYLRIEPRATYNITVQNGTVQVGDDTTGLTSAFAGEKITVSGKNRNLDFAKFGGWTVISPEDFELTDEQKNTEENMTFTMPDSPVKLKASYSFPAPVMDMPVTVNGGTIRVGEGESQTGTVLVQPGQTITVEANEPAKENESFHHWKVEEDSSKDIGIIEGSLGSETEKGTEKIIFTMPQDGVKLTAVYSIPAPVMKNTVTVEGGTAKSTLDEGSDIRAEIGTTVEITATPYDEDDYPGMMFMGWEIVYPDNFPDDVPEELQLKLADPSSTDTSFEMPAYPVKLVAQWSASPLDPTQPIDPDEPLDPGFGYNEGSNVGGAIAAVAVGGAAVWGGYEIATRVILHNILPKGASIPANRGELAMLIWTEQGKPEPAAQPAFTDVADAELAQAAQWCVEQGYMTAKGDRFDPLGWTPKFRVIEVWNKAFPR